MKIITQTCGVIKQYIKKYIKASTREGYAAPVEKWAQVQGLK